MARRKSKHLKAWRKFSKSKLSRLERNRAAYSFSHGHIARQMRAVTIHY